MVEATALVEEAAALADEDGAPIAGEAFESVEEPPQAVAGSATAAATSKAFNIRRVRNMMDNSPFDSVNLWCEGGVNMENESHKGNYKGTTEMHAKNQDMAFVNDTLENVKTVAPVPQKKKKTD